MKRSIALFSIVAGSLLFLSGCGGHEGGVIDTSENPYQVTESEQNRMNAANQAPEELVQADAAANGGQSPEEANDEATASQTDEKPKDLNGDNGVSYDPQ